MAGIEYGERQARLREDAERRAHADRRLGEAARSLRGDRLETFRRDYPELARLVSEA